MLLIGMKVLLIQLVLFGGAMGVPKVTEYFPEYKNDLTNLTWAHAVNNNSFLLHVLEDRNVRMIEADIRIADGIPVMKHDVETNYDITLSDFLKKIIAHNRNDNEANNRKGVKLDFKETEAFAKAVSVGILLDNSGKISDEFDFPVWINADIVRGPQGSSNAVHFDTALLQKLDAVTLSLGWTTGDVDKGQERKFSRDQFDAMTKEIEKLNVEAFDITFAVRAVYIVKNQDDFGLLLNGPNRSFTIWSAVQDTDVVDVADLRATLKDRQKLIYLDIPDELKKKL